MARIIIHPERTMKERYTDGLQNEVFLYKMLIRALAGSVNGRIFETYPKLNGIPSIGHMIPKETDINLFFYHIWSSTYHL